MDLPFELESPDEKRADNQAAFRVLIVDDEWVVRDVLGNVLGTEADLALSFAADAPSALTGLAEHRYDLLITDKNLPGIDGIELTAKAKELQPDLEAMIITGYANAESVIAALAAGASDYLVKPFDDIQVVKAKVRAALERGVAREMDRKEARRLAQLTADHLRRGQTAPEPAWDKLNDALSSYERAIRTEKVGKIVVVEDQPAFDALRRGGIFSVLTGWSGPEIEEADLVVIRTGSGEWRSLVERLKSIGKDVILLAHPEADLSDLLEAISLRTSLIGFGGRAPAAGLADCVKATLRRQGVEAAKRRVVDALAEFGKALSR